MGAEVQSPGREQSQRSGVICVYVEDSRDPEQVGGVLRRLRELGFVSRLNYKEDAATVANLYGRRASLYTSPQAQAGSRHFDRSSDRSRA